MVKLIERMPILMVFLITSLLLSGHLLS